VCIRGSFQGDFTAALTLSPSHCHPHILTLSPTHCHSHTVTLTPSSSHWHLHPHPHVNVYPTPCTLPLTLPSSHYRPHTVALNLTLILSHYDPHTFTNTHTAILTLPPSALSLSPSHRHPHSLPSHCHPRTATLTLSSSHCLPQCNCSICNQRHIATTSDTPNPVHVARQIYILLMFIPC